jgi:drug/metabolite transporter (DMT)-like permease
VISLVAALLAAVANSTSDVLNRKVTRDEPVQLQFRARLLLDLARHRLWLLSVLLMIAAFVLQAAALGTGQLAVVQPIVILELPLTLFLASRVLGGRLGRREWLGAAAMTAGVIGLLALLDPQAGPAGQIPPVPLIIGSAASGGAVLALFLAARYVAPGSRWGTAGQAALLGVAAGLAYGLSAAYTKGLTDEFTAGGLRAVLTSWPLYAAAVAGIGATWLLENAYQAGRLAAAQPGVTLADPVAGLIWGTAVFGEPVHGGVFRLLAVLPLLLLIAGAVELSRSPVLHGAGAGTPDQPPGVPAGKPAG